MEFKWSTENVNDSAGISNFAIGCQSSSKALEKPCSVPILAKIHACMRLPLWTDVVIFSAGSVAGKRLTKQIES